MGTKRSSGTVHTPKGINQGTSLIDPNSGNPIDVIVDSSGKKRLAVDANFVAQNVQATVELDYNEDSVQIGDPNTGATLKINQDGSIDSNTEVDAADGDNIGLKVQQRNLSPTDAQYNKRVTAKTGTGTDSDTTSLDISLHDENGNSYTALNPLSKGHVSTLNSTTAVLLAGAIFTGSFEEIKDFAFFSFSIISDQASITNGLEFQWSSDGINVDRIETTNLLANTGRSFSIGIRARYFRIKYTNGSTNQTFFRLNIVYHPNGTGIITKPLKGSVTEENFAQLTQSPIMARLKNGNYVNIAGISLNSTGILGVGDTTSILGNEGSSFKTSTNRLSTGSVNETPYLLMDNPTGSSKVIRLDKFIFLGPVDTADTVTYKIYVGPTITINGTLLEKIGNRQTGQATGVGNFYSLPTASANGSFNFIISVSGAAPPFVYELEHGTLIEPGFQILVTAQQVKSTSGGAVNVEYSETST